jgi:hypothetical protein
MTRDPLTLAYCAGLFDGDGSFSFQMIIRRGARGRRCLTIAPRLSMSLKYGGHVLDDLVACFGGQCVEYGSMRYWNLTRRTLVEEATRVLLPYLRLKRDIGLRFLEALELMPPQRAAHRRGERTWTEDAAVKVATIALTLNPTRKSPKGAGYIAQVREVFAANG